MSWLEGEVNREAWYGFRVKVDQVLELAVRDEGGRPQGTVIVKVLGDILLKSNGHLFTGKYVAASDPHYRWWASEGPGRGLSRKATYHLCEGRSDRCDEKRGRSSVLHSEKFRLITPDMIREKTPGWAHSRPCSTLTSPVFAEVLKMEKAGGTKGGLPWLDVQESEASNEQEESEEETEDEEEDSLTEKLSRLKKELKETEARMAMKASVKASQKSSKKKTRTVMKVTTKKSKKTRKEAKESDEEAKEKKKKKRKSGTGAEKSKASSTKRTKKAPSKKKKKDKKRGKSETSEEESEEDEEEKLFGGHGGEDEEPRKAKKKKDRGDGPAAPDRIRRASSRTPRVATVAEDESRRGSGLGGGGSAGRNKDPSNSGQLLPDGHVADPRKPVERENRKGTTHPQRGSRFAGEGGAGEGRRRSLPAPESAREERDRRPLASSPVLGTNQPGSRVAAGPQRGGLPGEAIPPGDEAEGPGAASSKRREGRPEGRQVPKAKRPREGQSRERQGKDRSSPQALAGEEENADQKEVPKQVDVRQWQRRWKKKLDEEQTALSMLANLWDDLPSLDTPLGRMAKRLTSEDVPSGNPVPKVRGDDLLPIDLDGAMDYLGANSDPEEARAILLLVLVLNYMWLGGRDSMACVRQRQKITKTQELTIDHLAERVRDLGAVPVLCSNFEEGRSRLVEARFDYAGEPVMSLEELKADLVVPVWPKIGEAAVQDVEPR
eukprot:Skav222453  [mRNA]  locus=scaffold3319:59315:61572:+ [translate_table: standard]